MEWANPASIENLRAVRSGFYSAECFARCPGLLLRPQGTRSPTIKPCALSGTGWWESCTAACATTPSTTKTPPGPQPPRKRCPLQLDSLDPWDVVNEATGVAAEAATILFNLPDYRLTKPPVLKVLQWPHAILAVLEKLWPKGGGRGESAINGEVLSGHEFRLIGC
jgi:hypothetical protein